MAGDIADAELRLPVGREDIVVIAPNFIGGIHVSGNVELRNACQLVLARQHHELHLSRNIELGAEAQVLALELLVEERDLPRRIGELSGSLGHQPLEVFGVVADFIRHAVEGHAHFADLIARGDIDARGIILVLHPPGGRGERDESGGDTPRDDEDDGEHEQQADDRAHRLPPENALRCAADLGLSLAQRDIDFILRDRESQSHALAFDLAVGAPQIDRRQATEGNYVGPILAVFLEDQPIDPGSAVGWQIERSHRFLRALRQIAIEPGHALATRCLVNAEPERLLAGRIDGENIAVGHGEKTETGIGDLDAVHKIGELAESDVGSDHAGHIGAVLGPQRMEEARDEIAGGSIDIRLGRGDVARDRAGGRRLEPRLPSFDHPRKEEIPEIRLVVAGIKLVEGLRLLGIGSGPEDGAAFRSHIVDLQLARPGRHHADAEQVECRAVGDRLRDLGLRSMIGVEEISPDAEDGGGTRLVLRPVAGTVEVELVAEIGIIGDRPADRRLGLGMIEQGLHAAGERGDLREYAIEDRLGPQRRRLDVVAEVLLVGVSEPLLDLPGCIAS